jgi:hypothetical protein
VNLAAKEKNPAEAGLSERCALLRQRDHIQRPTIAHPTSRADRFAAHVEQHEITGHRMNQVPRFHDRLIAHDDARPAERRSVA